MILEYGQAVENKRCKPRASGDDPLYPQSTDKVDRVNPARAGMIRMSTMIRGREWCKPRASGDDPGWLGYWVLTVG